MPTLEENKELYRKYGTTKPDEEFEIHDGRLVSIRVMVDERANELKAQRAKDLEIAKCREYNLRKKAEDERKREEYRQYNLKRKAEQEKKQQEIEECRRYNLMVRDLEMSGIEVRRK